MGVNAYSRQPRGLRLRTLVAESWRRCDLQVEQRDFPRWAPVRLDGAGLADYRQAHPLSPALDLCREVLADTSRDTGSVFALSDATGLLLWVEGDSTSRHRLEQLHFHEGADWSESCAGTNAPGTSLAIGAPVQIIAREHYNEDVRSWSCAAAPIVDPETGRPLGVVDLTGREEVATPQALAVVRATARAVEADLARRLAIKDARARRECGIDGADPRGPMALLSRTGRIVDATGAFTAELATLSGTDPDGATVAGRRRFEMEPIGAGDYLVVRPVGTGPHQRDGAGRGDAAGEPGVEPGGDQADERDAGSRGSTTARTVLTALGRDRAVLDVGGRHIVLTPRHSEVVVLLALAGEGQSAGRLAVDLFLGEGNEVAVRVTMTRLRKVLGSDLLASHPYRLCTQISCDVDTVRGLLDEGRVGEALHVYAGPLLPHSEAPAIVDHRVVLEQQLRGAVLATGDHHLLRRWVNAPWGADDVSAWERLAQALPVGTPQRAAVVARARALLTRGERGVTDLKPRHGTRRPTPFAR